MSIYDILWPIWIIAFAVIEFVAVRNDALGKAHGASLSSHLRRWFFVNTHPGRTVWLVTSGVFLAWFIPHIAG